MHCVYICAISHPAFNISSSFKLNFLRDHFEALKFYSLLRPYTKLILEWQHFKPIFAIKPNCWLFVQCIYCYPYEMWIGVANISVPLFNHWSLFVIPSSVICWRTISWAYRSGRGTGNTADSHTAEICDRWALGRNLPEIRRFLQRQS